MGNTIDYQSQQQYKIGDQIIDWNTYKKISTSRCKEANRKVRGLGTWAFGGNSKNQVCANNMKLKECLLIAKPQKRGEFVTFMVPEFSAQAICGISI